MTDGSIFVRNADRNDIVLFQFHADETVIR